MKEIFESHTVADLKREISSTNIRGYSKLKKKEIVELMMKHKEKFHHMELSYNFLDKKKKKDDNEKMKSNFEKTMANMKANGAKTREARVKDKKPKRKY
tara:strand:+ start:2961 stop:3257 length:297 start_codon:yes stop_codon:yes gene_type:complete